MNGMSDEQRAALEAALPQAVETVETTEAPFNGAQSVEFNDALFAFSHKPRNRELSAKQLAELNKYIAALPTFGHIDITPKQAFAVYMHQQSLTARGNAKTLIVLSLGNTFMNIVDNNGTIQSVTWHDGQRIIYVSVRMSITDMLEFMRDHGYITQVHMNALVTNATELKRQVIKSYIDDASK